MPTARTDTAGHHFGFAPMRYRHDLAQIAAKHGPNGFSFSPQNDFLMCVFGAHRDVVGMSDGAFFNWTPEQLWELARERSRGFHGDLVRLVEHGDPGVTLPVSIRMSIPVEPWPTTNATLLGDALHTMPPTAGVGANTALCDANLLCDRLSAVARGQLPLLDALADYEHKVREIGFARVEHSVQQATRLFDRIDLPRAAE